MMAELHRVKTGGRKPGGQNKVSREIRAAAMQHAGDAIAALVSLMAEAQNEAVRLAAAKELLDRSCGRTADAAEVIRFENADAQRASIERTRESMNR